MSEATGYGGFAHRNPRDSPTDERSDRIRRFRSSQPTWGVVADQLKANDLEIVGSEIRLSFEDRTTDDAVFDCAVANAFVQEGLSVTMIDPDGEVACE